MISLICDWEVEQVKEDHACAMTFLQLKETKHELDTSLAQLTVVDADLTSRREMCSEAM